MFTFRKLLFVINRALYVASAGLLIAGMVLTISPSPALAQTPSNYCPNNGTWDFIFPVTPPTLSYTAPAGQWVTEYCVGDGLSAPVFTEDIDPVTSLTIGVPSGSLAHASFELAPISGYGCMDPAAFNYDPAATVNGGCIAYCPVNSQISELDPACIIVEGCTDPAAFNYNADANQDNGSCVAYCQWNNTISANDEACAPIQGCTDSAAFNYNPSAQQDDGSCVARCAYNFDIAASDEACVAPPNPVPGCMDPKATNYNPQATAADGSCIYPSSDPVDPLDEPKSAVSGSSLIPVTGMPITPGVHPFTYGGLGFLGLGLVLQGYRKRMEE